MFDGRIAENFKLTTGTWVHVGALRIGMLAACSPVLQDAVIAGDDREFVGALVWLNAAGCQALVADRRPGGGVRATSRHPGVREHIVQAMRRWNSENPGTSTRIMRVLLLSDAPSIDANEITDKGYINQRLALERRRPTSSGCSPPRRTTKSSLSASAGCFLDRRDWPSSIPAKPRGSG